MAKQAVGKIERHLEKGVLAVTGLVFLAAVGRYLATTPNKIELTPGEFVTPDKIDDQIYEQAERARVAIQSAKPDTVEAVSVTPKFEAALDPLAFAQLPATLPRGVPFLPIAPLISTHRADGTIELVPPVAMDKPVLAAGRSRLAFEEEPITWNSGMDDKDDFPETSEDASWPVNWVTVSAVWNRQAQMDANEKAYGKGRAYALIGGVEVQRRARRADGSFNDEDWRTIEPYVRAKLPDTPELTFATDSDGKPVATSENLATATKVYTIVQDPIVQMNLLRPIVQPPLSGDAWKYPVIVGSEPVEQDDEWFRPDVDAGFKPSRAIMKDRYPRSKEEMKTLDLPWINGRRPTQEEARNWKVNFPLAEEAYTKALKEGDAYVEANAYNFVVRVHDMESSSQKTAQEMLKKFDDMKARMTGPKPPPKPGPKPAAQAQAQPEVVPHPKFPTQQVWAIDGNIDSVLGGRMYQYRVRLLLFNPFYGQPKALRNPTDARLPYIRGEWSPPSDPIYIEPDTQFFARSTTKERGEVSFDMYKWVEGVWVKATAKVGYGDVVACDSKVDVSDTKKELVQFNSEALLARLDTNRPWCDVARAGKNGVRFGAAQPAESIVLVDASGNVMERLLDLDRSDPKGKDLQGKVFKPQPKKVEAPKTGPPVGPPGRNARGGQRGGLSGNPYGEPMSDETKQRMKEEEEARKAGGKPPRP